MSYVLNDNIRKLTPYEPIEGEYRIRLDANESFIQLPLELIQETTQTVMTSQVNRYPDPRAARLCRSFASFYDIPHHLVTAGNGSDELISLIIGTFFQKGDELVTLSHDFSMYRFYADTLSVKASVYPKNADLTIDVDGVVAYVKQSKARGIIFSNPCNPTSLSLDTQEILSICQQCNELSCLVIVDEAYMDFASDSVMDAVETYSNLIVLKTASKAIGLAGIRLGFAVANQTLTQALQSVKSPYNVNMITQAIGNTVYSHPEYLNLCIERLIHSKDSLYQGILSIYAHTKVIEAVYPTATNFVFIKVKHAIRIFNELKEYSIAVRQIGDYLRITAGTKEENTEFLAIFARIIKKSE